MRLIFIRHPQTLANLSRVIYGRTESDYSEAGKQMIPWIVEQLRGTEIDAVYASPLQRTRRLAEAITEERENLPVQIDERLVEMHFGIFENMSNQDAKTKHKTEYDGFLSDYNEYVIPEGESFRQVQERAVAFVEELADLYGGHGGGGPDENWDDTTEESGEEGTESTGRDQGGEVIAQEKRDKTIVVVSHSMVIHAVLAHLLKMDLKEIWHIKVEPGTIVNVLYQWDFAMLEELKPPVVQAG